MMMANLGMADTLILLVLALVVFGPRRLPQIGRQVGKLMYEFRKASNDFKFQMEEELRTAEEADRRKKQEEERQRALAAAPPQPRQVEQTTSPAPESDAAGPGSGAHAPAAPESPYQDPYEGLYQGLQQGESSPSPRDDAGTPQAETPQAEATEAPAEQPFVPPFIPRIQPPSTGQTVSAERPGAEPKQQELFSAVAGNAPESADSETAGSEPQAERSEPADHHG